MPLGTDSKKCPISFPHLSQVKTTDIAGFSYSWDIWDRKYLSTITWKKLIILIVCIGLLVELDYIFKSVVL